MVRPTTSGYARLAQEDELHHSSDEDDDLVNERGSFSRGHRVITVPPEPMSIFRTNTNGGNRLRPTRSNSSGVDIKAINARLEKWAEEIANKFKRKSKDTGKQQQLEIYYSVFVPPEGMKPLTVDYD